MASLRNETTARIVGIWRSRTVRLLCYGVLLWILGAWAARHGLISVAAMQKGPLKSVDSVVYQGAAFKLFSAVIGVVAVQNVLWVFDNHARLGFRSDWLPELMKGNAAVALYLGCRFIGTCILVGLAIG